MTHRETSSLSAPGSMFRHLLSLTLVALVLTLTACKASGKGRNDEDDKDNTPKSELITGFWEQETEKGESIKYMAFHEDGTVLTDKKISYGYNDLMDYEEEEFEICCGRINWVIKGKTLTIENTYSNETHVYTIRKLNEKTMVLVDGANEGKLTFRRIDEAQYKKLTGEPTTLEGRNNQLSNEPQETDTTTLQAPSVPG